MGRASEGLREPPALSSCPLEKARSPHQPPPAGLDAGAGVSPTRPFSTGSCSVSAHTLQHIRSQGHGACFLSAVLVHTPHPGWIQGRPCTLWARLCVVCNGFLSLRFRSASQSVLRMGHEEFVTEPVSACEAAKLHVFALFGSRAVRHVPCVTSRVSRGMHHILMLPRVSTT